jgi:hypothetical protein
VIDDRSLDWPRPTSPRPVAIRDADDIRQTLASRPLRGCDDREQARRWIARLRADPVDRDRLYARPETIARLMIDDAWPIIETVATELLDRGTLTGDEFDSVVAPWPALRASWALAAPWEALNARDVRNHHGRFRRPERDERLFGSDRTEHTSPGRSGRVVALSSPQGKSRAACGVHDCRQ